MAPFPIVINQLPGGKWIILDCAQHEISVFSLLDQTLNSGYRFAFPAPKASPKTATMDLLNALFTNMTFHTALLWVKKLTS